MNVGKNLRVFAGKSLLFLAASCSYMAADCWIDDVYDVQCYDPYEHLKKKSNSGFFVGLDVGAALANANWSASTYPITVPANTTIRIQMADIAPNSGVGFSIGANIGYKLELGSGYGLRYYIDYRYMQGSNKRSAQVTLQTATNVDTDLLLRAQMLTANVDFYAQFRGGFGFYAGVGLGYHAVSPRLRVSSTTLQGGGFTEDARYRDYFTLPVNVGLTYNFNRSHQLLLSAKIPLFDYEYSLVRLQGPVKGRVYVVNAGYSYLF